MQSSSASSVTYISYCIYVVLLSAQWGGSNGIEAWSLGLLFLQCFDTVGWVFDP